MNIKCIKVGYLETNCYIVESNNNCLIIDPGDDADKIINSISCNVKGILITHNHFDHIGALNELVNYYNVRYYDNSNLNEGLNNICNFSFIVKKTYGHTFDCCSFIFDNIMFSGDFIFKGCIGRYDLGGDKDIMINSIRDIIKSDINYKIYPGHGDYTYLFDEIDNLKRYL